MMAPVAVTVELCVRTPPVTVKLVSAVVLPAAPVNVTAPVPATKVNASAPLIVLLKEILPLFAEVVIAALPVKLTGLGNVSVVALVTVMFAPI